MCPGFKKEQLRVQIDNFGRLRISGERPLRADSKRWKRFSKDFHVPDGCNAGAIRARLEKSGALLITMPRLSPPAADTGGVDAAQDKQLKDHHASGARQESPPAAAAAAADEAAGEQQNKEEDASDASTERRGQDEQHLASNNDAGGEASSGRPEYGLATRSRRSMVWAIVAVVLTLVGAGLYARYRLMDPTAETAPTGSQIVPLSDH
jgi:hypothetical protein